MRNHSITITIYKIEDTNAHQVKEVGMLMHLIKQKLDKELKGLQLKIIVQGGTT